MALLGEVPIADHWCDSLEPAGGYSVAIVNELSERCT